MDALMKAVNVALDVMENTAADLEASGWDETSADLSGAADTLEKAFRTQTNLSEAAPAMLAALEELVRDFDNWGEVLQQDDNGSYGPTSPIEAARAAISLATGERE